MMFYTRVSCDPPLSQSTVIPHGDDKIRFTILLETNEITSAEDWEVNLWHNCHGTEWSALDLDSLYRPGRLSPLAVKRDINRYRKHFFFTGVIERPQGSSNGEFTIKYRRKDKDWIWVNSATSFTNGSLVFQASSLPKDLTTSFSRFPSNIHPISVRSDVSDTKLWSLEFPVPAADKASGTQDTILGVPLYVARWWTLVRQWAAWLIPAHGHGVFEVDKDALVCSFQCRDGLNLVLLGISGVDNVQTVFRDDGFGGIVVRTTNDRSKANTARVLASIGFSHESALAACVYAARNLVQRGSYSIPDVETAEIKSDNDLKTTWHSSWRDGLGYCTWNGIGQQLTEEKIFNALKTLRESNVKIQTLIIDDNWQTLDQSHEDHHYHTWSDFEANKEGFPQGLGSTVKDIREQNPSLKHIAVWHAMFGYWGGITPDGPIAEKYKTKQIRRKETGKKGFEATAMTIIDEDDIQELFEDFYKFLTDAGVDGVKTDVQMMLDLIEDPKDRKQVIRAYQNAWNLHSLQSFQDRTISCMSHFPDNFFHSLLPRNRPAITLRNSDDFWPTIPESHPWHVFTNAHNALFTQHLNVVPDWDMFQTTHEFAAFHAAARCISGGPIYITDEPGKHDFDLIKQMTAETVQGETVILRPSCVARAVTSSIYISDQEPRLLKVGSYHGSSMIGTSILGVFNCSRGPLLDLVHLRDFRGVRNSQQHIVRSFRSGQLSEAMTLDGDASVISVDLEVRGWDILTSYPLWTMVRGEKTIDVVPLGLIEKMSGAAAILNYTISPDEGQRSKLTISLKALGILGIYISDLDNRTVEDDFMIMISESIIPVETVRLNGNVLEIDVEAAWKAAEQEPSWSNEITLDIYMAW